MSGDPAQPPAHPLAHPEWTLTPEQLSEQMEDPALRIFEATVHLDRPPGTEPSPHSDYQEAHIPGAVFLDHTRDLSDPRSSVPYTRLEPEALSAAFASFGVSEQSRVVVYSAGHVMWATRVFWLLRGIGFDRAAVLDGGFARWRAEGRPVERGSASYPPGSLTPRPRPEVWADRDDVKAAIGDGAVCTIDALPGAIHRGEADHHYGRPGHIAGSLNVPFSKVVDRETGTFKNPAAWREAFEEVGALERDRIITYCGGGISATVDAFALVQLGHSNVAVYDGSLSEWSADADLPMETP